MPESPTVSRLSFATAVSLKFSRHLSQSLILPSLPAIMIGLSAPQNMTQLVVGAFIVGMVIAKLIVIFLADYLKLRRTILIMMPFLLVGSLLCLIPKIEILLIGRAMQGIGIGGASALGISIIKNTTSRENYVKKLSRWAIWVEWAPPMALVLGGFVQNWLGWYYNFVIVGLVSVVLTVLAIVGLPKEARTKSPHRGIVKTLRLIGIGYMNREFLAYSLMYSFVVSGQVVFYTISPFYLIHSLGMPADDYGLALIPYFAALILGAALLGYIQPYFSSIVILRIGLLFGFLGAIAILAFSFLGMESPMTLILSMALYGLGHSMLGLQTEVRVSQFFSETPVANLGLLGLTLAIVSSLIAILAAHTPSADVNYMGFFLLALVLLSYVATLALKGDD